MTVPSAEAAGAAFLDASAGVAGDMLLGALVDAGLPLAVLEDVVAGLGLEDVSLSVHRTQRGALAATKVDVLRGGAPVAGVGDVHLRRPGAHEHGHGHGHGHEHGHGHGTLHAVLERIALLGDPAAAPWDGAVRAFRELAAAEARVHGTTPDEVHFHEVGAADALVDVVGTCAGLHHLGVTELYVSPLPWSQGTVQTAHGTLPLPAPATVHLLAGHPTFASDEGFEQVTPTGAALVRALARGTSVPFGFRPAAVGCGAGTRERTRLPNVVRLVLGTREETPEGEAGGVAVLLETNLDDVTGQVLARAIACCLEAGALDAWSAPVTMKKGRPGAVLSALARPADRQRIEAVLFRETPTLGIRSRLVERTELPRREESVETRWGAVRVKVRETPGGPEVTPEHDDCLAVAREQGVSLQSVIEEARAAWREA